MHLKHALAASGLDTNVMMDYEFDTGWIGLLQIDTQSKRPSFYLILSWPPTSQTVKQMFLYSTVSTLKPKIK